MAAFRDTLKDNMGGGLGTYPLPIGHETEDPVVRQSGLERSALTTGEGFVRQQGAPQPTIIKFAGWANVEAQVTKMTEFYNACQGIGTPARTVWLQQVGPVENWIEVLITEFTEQRVVGRAGGTGLGYVWKWNMTFEVI